MEPGLPFNPIEAALEIFEEGEHLRARHNYLYALRNGMDFCDLTVLNAYDLSLENQIVVAQILSSPDIKQALLVINQLLLPLLVTTKTQLGRDLFLQQWFARIQGGDPSNVFDHFLAEIQTLDTDVRPNFVPESTELKTWDAYINVLRLGGTYHSVGTAIHRTGEKVTGAAQTD